MVCARPSELKNRWGNALPEQAKGKNDRECAGFGVKGDRKSVV